MPIITYRGLPWAPTVETWIFIYDEATQNELLNKLVELWKSPDTSFTPMDAARVLYRVQQGENDNASTRQ